MLCLFLLAAFTTPPARQWIRCHSGRRSVDRAIGDPEMNKKQIAITIIVLLAALFAGRTLAQGPALPAGEYDLEAGQYVFNVPALAVTATPIPPTETPVPPTSTPVPAPATLTATPEGTVLPYAGAPLTVARF